MRSRTPSPRRTRTPSAADASLRSTERSGPKIFTARLAFDPEIMWSFR
jgi:hypothetical protein